MSTPTTRARAAELLDTICATHADDVIDAILRYADEIRREERAALQAAITPSAREIRRLEKKLGIENTGVDWTDPAIKLGTEE